VSACNNNCSYTHASFLHFHYISGFITEVHHVNGKGENKGVVYCEMQVRKIKVLHISFIIQFNNKNCSFPSTHRLSLHHHLHLIINHCYQSSSFI